MTQLAPLTASRAPALFAKAGDRASYRFLEFFTAQIRNPNTRSAYVRAMDDFLTWLEAHGVASIRAYVRAADRARQVGLAG